MAVGQVPPAGAPICGSGWLVVVELAGAGAGAVGVGPGAVEVESEVVGVEEVVAEAGGAGEADWGGPPVAVGPETPLVAVGPEEPWVAGPAPEVPEVAAAGRTSPGGLVEVARLEPASAREPSTAPATAAVSAEAAARRTPRLPTWEILRIAPENDERSALLRPRTVVAGTYPGAGSGAVRFTADHKGVGTIDTPDRQADRVAIEALKHAYFRLLDTKRFEELGELLTEDVTTAYDSGQLAQRGRRAVVAFLEASLGDPSVVTMHTGHHPEIVFASDDTASGTWYLEDRVIVPAADLELHGTALYHDEYRRQGGRWRISATGYDRIFEERRRRSSGELLSLRTMFDRSAEIGPSGPAQ